MTISFATSLLNSRADQITAARDGGSGAGSIRIYDGTRPAKGGTATTLLAEVNFSDPSGSSSNGVLTANNIAAQDAVANGTASWFREVDSGGAFVLDGSITADGGGGDLEVNTTQIVVGNPVEITSYTITEANG